MVPLEFILKRLAYPSGVLISFNSSRNYKWIIWCVGLITVIYLLSESAFYFANIEDLNESTACLGTLVFVVTSFIRVVLILQKNRELRDLIQVIRQMYRERSSVQYLSRVSEKKSRKYTIFLLCSAYLTLLMMMLSPLLNMYLEFNSTGKVEQTRWELPYKLL